MEQSNFYSIKFSILDGALCHAVLPFAWVELEDKEGNSSRDFKFGASLAAGSICSFSSNDAL